jgi:hypothetical protein
MHRTSIRTLTLAAITAVSLPSAAFAGEAAERAASQILRDRMKTQRPEDLRLMETVKGKDIVVVKGTMDHIEDVLRSAGIRHTLIRPRDVAGHDLTADMIVMVNCPGNIPRAGVERIARFVRAGGLLYTTDWALLNLIQKAFPGTVAHNGGSTDDELTPVRVHAEHEDLMSNLLLASGRKPQWYLEGGSYPIKILDSQRVQVLASSPTMGKRYGGAPVVVRFRWDDGEVIHVVSHFYRQLDAKGPQVAAAKKIDEVKGMTPSQKAAFKASGGAALNFSDVESSYAFQQMTTNLVVGKKKGNATLDKQYGFTPKAELDVGGRKVAPGARIKVLSRKDGKARVRDDRGYEAEVPEDALEAR